MRVLAIDFGESRIGLAISDPAGALAVPLTVLERRSDREAIQHIERLIEEQGVERVVVGEPRNLDGTLGDAARRVHSFCRKLASRIEQPCVLVDEGLTSVEARERLREAGTDLRRHPERVDQVAAQILLEQYLTEALQDTDA